LDDRTWYLAIGSLSAAVVAILLDAALANFNVPSGMWAFLSGMLGFLGARSAFKRDDGGR
jgi:hypothetical protein